MVSGIIDSEIYRDIYVSDEMRKVFSDESLMQKWLDSWVALAESEEEEGVIPEKVSKKIAEKADYHFFNMETIRKGIIDTTHPLIVQLREYTKIVDGEASKYIHWGATTQDIMDTAVALQIKDAVDILQKQLKDVLKILLSHAKKYENTIMPGRTHGQHALPITLGYKIAIWADEVGKHLERLEEGKKRFLIGSFHGATGTLASLKEKGLSVQKRYCKKLNLQQPTISWHVQRDGFAEFSSIIAMISSTIGKIANEIINLQKSEIGELEEGFKLGQVGSSTMPHKRNPMICEYIVGITRIVQKNASISFDNMIQEHERDMTTWASEWSYIPQICILTSGQLKQIHGIFERWIVHDENMNKNLYLLQGLIVSENLMLNLGKFIGREEAHDIIYQISMEAFEKKKPLVEIAIKNEIIMTHLTENEVRDNLDPKEYTGISSELIDRVIKKWTT